MIIALIAVIVAAVIVIVAIHRRHRLRVASMRFNHHAHAEKLRAIHLKHIRDRKAEYNRSQIDADAEFAHNLAAAEAKAEIEQARLTEQITQLRVLYDSATDALAHQATAHGETPEGKAAALALYAGHLVGLWQPAKDQGRLLAKGLRLAAFAPTDHPAILDRLRSMQPAIHGQ